MPSFYMFSEEQLRKLKIRDLLKLANYYHVEYSKTKPNADTIIVRILKAQQSHNDDYIGTASDEPQKMSVRVRRIYEQNRQE